MSMLAVSLGLAAAIPAGSDPVSMTEKGFVECAFPDDKAKTCLSMTSYRRGNGGAIFGESQAVLNMAPFVVMKGVSKVTLRSGQMCGRMDKAEFANYQILIDGVPASSEEVEAWYGLIQSRAGIMMGHEVCYAYSGRSKFVTAVSSIGGRPAWSTAITIHWVRPHDGYRLVRAEDQALTESVGGEALVDLSPSSD